MRRSDLVPVFLVLVIAFATVAPAFAESGQEESTGKRTSARHSHHVGFAAGTIVQTEGGGAETGRYSLEYEYVWRNPQTFFTEKWGVGAMVEFDRPPIDSIFIAAHLTYHPVPQARLVIAPAYNVGRGEEGVDSWAMRLGMAWEFEIGERFSIAPQIFYDALEAGDRAAVLAVSIGYAF